jgi:hypothetical protein
MTIKNCYLLVPDVKFGTSDITVKQALLLDTYVNHVDPIAKVYIDESFGTVFMPLSMLYKTKHDALIALRDMCYRIAKDTENELKAYEQREDSDVKSMTNGDIY